jgi:hypothetical protein
LPTLPPPPARHLSLAEAAAVAKRGRKLLRAGRITHRQLALLDCLLWSCRNPATGAIVVSYTALQRLARMARATIAEALSVLQRLGVLSRIKRRVRQAWHQGGVQTRQATSCYLLHPGRHSEFSGRTVHQKSDSVEFLYVQQPTGDLVAAQVALARRRTVVEERLLSKGSCGTVGP